jgi:N-acetyl-gamma-glutamylphosphate reductase
VLCVRKQARDGGGLVSVVVYSVSVVMQKEAVYGLTEIYREEVRAARLVANPGCYPTTVQLPLIPLLQVGLC